ncbi:MAG: hypothetical protein GF400_07900 [Candidatus Eisenbacteria bacterium]|nr:hypothetical protein [Candidatus Eisenbacteria bacterium]
MEGNTIFDKILRVDRRWIFLLVAIAVVVPFILPLGLPVTVTSPVQRLYEKMDSLPANSQPLLLSVDYAPATLPELEPMTLALLRHAFENDVNVVVITLHPAGYGLAERALLQAAEEYDRVYGEDYVFLGFQPGISAVILSMGVNIRNAFPEDAYGTALTRLPVMDGVRNYDDIPLVITLAGSAYAESWIYYAHEPYGQMVAAGVTAVMATDYYPYLGADQLEGLLGGMRGAAEYEALIEQPDQGTRGMDSQSIIHMLIILLIVIGNVAYFATRKSEKKTA